MIDFVDRRKLDFVTAAKLILLVEVRGEEGRVSPEDGTRVPTRCAGTPSAALGAE
jgi:hypothetical protein